MKVKVVILIVSKIQKKQADDFFQFIIETRKNVKGPVFESCFDQSHAVQLKALKDLNNENEVMVLTKLTLSKNLLSYIDRTGKHL